MEIKDIINTWRSSGIELNKAAKLSEINQLETFLQFEFPKSFKEFYTETNGFKDYDWNEHMFTIYSLERIKEEYQELENKNFIPFSDYLINCYQIGFSKTSKGIYIDYNNNLGNFNDMVAEDFKQSLVEILNNSDKIY
jgi:hypothetical protein